MATSVGCGGHSIWVAELGRQLLPLTLYFLKWIMSGFCFLWLCFPIFLKFKTGKFKSLELKAEITYKEMSSWSLSGVGLRVQETGQLEGKERPSRVCMMGAGGAGRLEARRSPQHEAYSLSWQFLAVPRGAPGFLGSANELTELSSGAGWAVFLWGIWRWCLLCLT